MLKKYQKKRRKKIGDEGSDILFHVWILEERIREATLSITIVMQNRKRQMSNSFN